MEKKKKEEEERRRRSTVCPSPKPWPGYSRLNAELIDFID
jgi:hypothetical protein